MICCFFRFFRFGSTACPLKVIWSRPRSCMNSCALCLKGRDQSLRPFTWLRILPTYQSTKTRFDTSQCAFSCGYRSDKDLLGPNNQNLSKIVGVFTEVYSHLLFHILFSYDEFESQRVTWQVLCAGKELATEQTTARMVSLLRQLQQTLPPAVLASTWSSLQPQQQLALQSVLSS